MTFNKNTVTASVEYDYIWSRAVLGSNEHFMVTGEMNEKNHQLTSGLGKRDDESLSHLMFAESETRADVFVKMLVDFVRCLQPQFRLLFRTS